MSSAIFLFETTRAAIKAERICLEYRIPCKTGAIPREISTDCGVALKVEEKFADETERVLTEHMLSYTRHMIDN